MFRRMQHYLVKCQYTSTEQHGVASHTTILTGTATRTCFIMSLLNSMLFSCITCSMWVYRPKQQKTKESIFHIHRSCTSATRDVNLAINLPTATQIRGVSVSSWNDSMVQLVFCTGSIISESCPCTRKCRIALAVI
jgi:hypothetical protein